MNNKEIESAGFAPLGAVTDNAPMPTDILEAKSLITHLRGCVAALIDGQALPQAPVEPLTDEQILQIAEQTISHQYSVGRNATRFQRNEWEIIEFARALLATPPASKATEPKADTYAGVCEDLAIWKKRALNAEDLLRIERDTTKRLCAELNDANGPTFMGEPLATSKADTGEASNRIIRTTWNAAMEEAAITGGRAAAQCKNGPDGLRVVEAIRALKSATPSTIMPDADDTLLAFDLAFDEEIKRVSTLEYNSNEICRHFYQKLRERVISPSTIKAEPTGEQS